MDAAPLLRKIAPVKRYLPGRLEALRRHAALHGQVSSAETRIRPRRDEPQVGLPPHRHDAQPAAAVDLEVEGEVHAGFPGRERHRRVHAGFHLVERDTRLERHTRPAPLEHQRLPGPAQIAHSQLDARPVPLRLQSSQAHERKVRPCEMSFDRRLGRINVRGVDAALPR